MNTTLAPQPKYHIEQRVEVEVTDFETPGFPLAWLPGIVRSVEWDEKVRLFVLNIAMDSGRSASLLVGRRGGQKALRPLVSGR
jgi:hypothetical protein